MPPLHRWTLEGESKHSGPMYGVGCSGGCLVRELAPDESEQALAFAV